MTNIYFFQWISDLGGADTRLKELIQLLSKTGKYKLHSIPNDNFRLEEKNNRDFLESHGVKILSWEELPEKAEGFGITFSNFRIFSESWRIDKIKSMGLKFIWSNDMMWHTDEEISCLNNKLIDAAIYTSQKHYEDISIDASKNVKEFIVPNYFYLENYEYIERPIRENFVIGKHSRADLLKFSDDFPNFYENLKITRPKYRVMGFNKYIKTHFRWFEFNSNWDLLEENQEETIKFLKSLDCYVYNCHPTFTETQCRATIEAMLTGLPVVAPAKENFKNQIQHNKSGFIWDTYEECIEYVKFLEQNADERIRIGKLAREVSIDLWCNPEKQLQIWENIFSTI